MSEIIEDLNELKVYAVNGELIPFDGWVAIMTNLPGNRVFPSFLVTSLAMERPLVGFNVLEEIIQGQPERLICTLVKLLCDAISVPVEKAKAIVSFIQTVEPISLLTAAYRVLGTLDTEIRLITSLPAI
ncbi:hypothetical protein NHX12_028093 [Muraenolepis orangiensis]|uniref:Uncharacterized protein n=1 Tax=Muraenolepis orangiensis TaxID=630683 RepID=A0A9Q0EIL7_9TELE|nr:hypothetical protein NHX12_028093 [Muraenolepis orangiensis]